MQTVSKKKNANKYPTVETLPANAMTVQEYANSIGKTTSHLYVMLQRGKADFKVVLFKGINFIIP